ncbi:DNA-binding protein [Halarcobacter mediterraneus]|uniref:DNA-binding protein n=1 Tax=Halarcobacter mediterraneus TaxID=2023153 RepID=A0A4Q1B298_9BACT|nr:helix-turn-helix domain-containing protein [Halarcobacter mediterraneus]RXK12746.1 DNA-binding protein [Halarcobacter mediterraneus]
MERLVTTAQAAQILGLSLQGVHYRIRKNQLKSIKKAGKTYVYISEYVDDKAEAKVELKESTKSTFEDVINVKNEQIDILKKSIKWMRKQYSSEIHRLEKNQKRIISVFNREIELLQSAFNEMRSIYKQPQVAQSIHKEEVVSGDIEVEKEELKEKFISLQEFTLYLKKHHKNEKDIKLIIFKAIQKQDSRFIYNRKDKKLLILNEDFSDLI